MLWLLVTISLIRLEQIFKSFFEYLVKKKFYLKSCVKVYFWFGMPKLLWNTNFI